MIWKAIMDDGKEIYQSHNGVETALSSIDKNKLSVFSIIDSLHTFVNLDLSNGGFDLNNLDLQKISELKNGELLNLVYDADQQKFKLTHESLLMLNSLILNEERSNFVSFDQTGKFNINGMMLYLGFEQNGILEKFINQPPYNNVVQFNDAVTDFLGSRNNNNPYKRIDATLAYHIGYTKDYIFNTTEFKLSLVLKYDIVQKCVSLNCLITVNKNISGKLTVYFGNSQSTLDVNLTANEPASLNRIITLM
jgi:hypothetical protein